MDKNKKSVINKIRMLHLISSTAFLGAERVICELVTHLDPARYMCVVGLIGPSDIVEYGFRSSLEGTRISVVHFPCASKVSLITIRSIADFINCQQIDIVHSHGYKSNFHSFFSRIFAGNVRTVATNHNWIVNSLSEKLYRLIDLLVLKRFTKIVAVSQQLKDEMIAKGIAPDKISLIMNGISLADPHTAYQSSLIRSKLGILEGCFVVGCVASLIPVKSHADLLNAISRLVEVVPDSMLLLLGDGPLQYDLKQTVISLNLQEKVVFLGHRSDARAFYSAFDAFALVSSSEGLPMAMLEAMITALPVVVSSVGSIPQVVHQMENGIIITPGDIDCIANALIKLSQEPALRELLGRNARSEVVANYSVGRMARDYGQLYEDVLENKS